MLNGGTRPDGGVNSMRVVSTVTITPEQPTGLFRPDSMSEWVGHLIHVAGLDTQFDHTLQGVEITPGPRMVLDVKLGRYVEQVVNGGTAVLTVLTEAPFVPCHASYVRVLSGMPPARAQIVQADTAEVLVERGRYPAPKTVGQQIAVGDNHYHVVGIEWPNRDPDHGSSGAAEDYQRVLVLPIPDQEPLQLLH